MNGCRVVAWEWMDEYREVSLNLWMMDGRIYGFVGDCMDEENK